MDVDIVPSRPDDGSAAFSTSFLAQSLHGRQAERDQLALALQRIQNSARPEVIMIAGGGGVGKSTLARWLVTRAREQHAATGEGKCYQLSAEIPYAAVAQAVRRLTVNALDQDDEALDALARRWLARLGGHGNSITELVPEARHVLGSSNPPVSVLTPQGQERIERALIRTLEAFSWPGRPTVVLLDDLQWADEATLSFLEAFVAAPPDNVLLLGTYRDDGAGFARRYSQARHANRAAGANFTDITLESLNVAALEEIVGETLRQPPQPLAGLVAVLHARSGGNPYFAQQLLHRWVDDGALQRREDGAWQWSEATIGQSRYAGQVIDLLVQRIAKLPPTCQLVLRHLACVGMHCDADLLASVCDIEDADFSAAVTQLTANGLLVRHDLSLMFQHDRVLEAAYALIDADGASAAHAQVARRMAAYWHGELAEHAYAIGNQIEKIAPADMRDAEQALFVRILLAAARRAQRASAVDRAYAYNQTATSIMTAHWWHSEFALAYEAALIECECLIAKTELALAAQQLARISARSLPPGARASLHRLDAVLHTLRSDYEGAIDAALAGLAILGVPLVRHPAPTDIHDTYLSVKKALNGRAIGALTQLPVCEDEQVNNVMALLATLISSFFTTGDIGFTHLAKLVELTLRHGVCQDSPYGMAWYGVFISSYYGEYEDGYAYGLAALAIVDRHGFESGRLATLVALDQVAVWTQPLGTALNYARQASARGTLSGDVGMACYACNHIVSDLLAMGAALPLVDDAAEHGKRFARSIGYVDIELLIQSQSDFVHVLSHGNPHQDPQHWVAQCQQRVGTAQSLPTKFWVWLYAGMSAAFYRQWELAAELLHKAKAFIAAVPAHINLADWHLFYALSVSRAAPPGDAAALAMLGRTVAQFEVWTRHNPRTFESKLQLLQGELARAEGEHLRALSSFERSATSAGVSGFVHEQALAHELAAILCREQAVDLAGDHHARRARAAYLQWGAGAKAASLAVLLLPEGEAGEAAGAQDASALERGLKAAQALSQEAVREKLVETMMSDLLVHAGAHFSVLIRLRDGVPMIEGSGRVTGAGIVTSIAVVEPTASIIAPDLLNVVMRTRQPLVMNHVADDAFSVLAPSASADAPCAILCLPLLRAGVLIGVLYLENQQTPGVFTPSLVARLELIASQIAIALDYAQLYEQLLAANNARSHAERDLHVARAELVKNAHITLLANLGASIAHEINQPLGAIVASADASARWLNRAVPDIDRAQTGLQQVKKEGMRAAGIIRSLRGLATQTPSVLEPIGVPELVSGVVGMLSTDLGAADVSVNLQLAPDAVVTGDRIQLQQVILNLINNAIDAMRANGADARREITVATRRQAACWQIGVEDSGPGIGEEELERIFKPFYTTKDTGLGMGLAICRTIAEAHGGTLTARRLAAGGSAFVIELPTRAP